MQGSEVVVMGMNGKREKDSLFLIILFNVLNR